MVCMILASTERQHSVGCYRMQFSRVIGIALTNLTPEQRVILSDTMPLFISVRKSSPQQNRRLATFIRNSE